MRNQRHGSAGSARVVVVGLVLLVLAVPFARWLGLGPVALTALLAVILGMTVWVAIRTAMLERRTDDRE